MPGPRLRLNAFSLSDHSSPVPELVPIHAMVTSHVNKIFAAGPRFTRLDRSTRLHCVLAAPARRSEQVIEAVAVRTCVCIREHQAARSVIAPFRDPPLHNC
jgi:hypothetical protein